MTKEFPAGQNKYLIPVRMDTGSNSWTDIGISPRITEFIRFTQNEYRDAFLYDINENEIEMFGTSVSHNGGIISSGDILYIALDMDEGTLSFGKN